MSVSDDVTRRNSGSDLAKEREAKDAARRSKSKPTGTRVGVLVDWRGAEKGTGETARRNRLRDGS
jgi:hypothetical protein